MSTPKPERNKKIAQLIDRGELTLEQIGRAYGISKPRVWKIYREYKAKQQVNGYPQKRLTRLTVGVK